MNIPIFCINLERATERKELIQKEWIDKLNLDIVFWSAYDRRRIENKEYFYPYDEISAKNNFLHRELNDGEIACATSFCMLYEHILKNNYSEAIIMEDDITPLFDNKSELFTKIEQGKKEFPNADIMLLHEYPLIDKKKVYGIKKDIFSMCDKSPWGNQFFYANRKAITALYHLLKIIKFPADYPQLLLSAQKRVIIVNQPMCYHEWTGPNSKTYIGNSLRGTNRKFIE
jgi:GR25 family glycosyltransferase involved in LPS biosynthesis